MHREFFNWWSDRLQMEMPLVRYGHWGPALLVFPTWQSDLMEAESKGLIGAIAQEIEAEKVSVWCVNSISPQAWCNDSVPMPEKARLQALYSGYIEEEVVPHIRRVMRDPAARLAATGASFGAFFAANAVFRRPDLFGALLGMSGFYSLEQVVHGFSNDEIYFNCPEWFVPALPEGPQLELLRNDTRIELYSGRGAHEAPQFTERFAGVLAAKGIPARADLWGHEWPHEWLTWKRMLQVGVRERLGF